MKEFMHKCWGPKEPYTHHSRKSPIDGGYKTPEVEIVNLSMLTFAESPGDHRSFILDVSTRSFLGVYRYKVCQPVSQRLVTSQESSVKKYNEPVRYAPRRRAAECSGQYDKILWVPFAMMVTLDYHKAVHTDDRD
jgi:hypothetical protein